MQKLLNKYDSITNYSEIINFDEIYLNGKSK